MCPHVHQRPLHPISTSPYRLLSNVQFFNVKRMLPGTRVPVDSRNAYRISQRLFSTSTRHSRTVERTLLWTIYSLWLPWELKAPRHENDRRCLFHINGSIEEYGFRSWHAVSKSSGRSYPSANTFRIMFQCTSFTSGWHPPSSREFGRLCILSCGSGPITDACLPRFGWLYILL